VHRGLCPQNPVPLDQPAQCPQLWELEEVLATGVAAEEESGDGWGPSPGEAAWKRVYSEKKSELTSLVEEGALQGTRKSKRLLINAGSFFDWMGEEAPVWPDWGLEFDIIPDSQAKEGDRRRRARESARQSLVRGPSFTPLLRRASGKDKGSGRDGVGSGVDGMVAALEDRLREGASTWWQGLVAAERVVDEVASEFGGEDPLRPVERDAARRPSAAGEAH